ncbi:ABC transporter ATP-binding protein [Burkholderia sp. Bp9131]|uniref:ABC transporter ATP-binding protein n=1 Tax=Burkholderia sp. Bp9131 TaxID=2184571 RepID=UPI000F57DF6D|nr:ABC transporter ATP-binding protein [Burkholderia sp. Bp9131]RQR44712.1 ABC transporter ATP-binding protein [Burkholderia sp. Bp9131]
MIELKDVSKHYRLNNGAHIVFDNLNLQINRGEKIGVLGRNGAGKSTLIRLISGAELPTKGRVHRKMSVSWPLAFGGAFQGSLTGVDNIRFICRVYNADLGKAIPLVEDFAELGRYLREPVKTYSSGMRARLAFAISMAIEFDCFLIDEVIAVGDARFHEKCQNELFEKRRDRAMVIVSHEPKNIQDHCDKALVLHRGVLHQFPEVDAAYNFYNQHC